MEVNIQNMKDVIRMLEVGVLLDKRHPEYESYNNVWDQKHGFFNENNILYREKDTEEAIDYARQYVKKGVDNTYAIISNEGECEWEGPFDDGNLDITSKSFDMADVIFSIVKINGTVIENWLTEK